MLDGKFIDYNKYEIKNLIPDTYYKIKLEAINIYGSDTLESEIFKTDKSIPIIQDLRYISYFSSIKIIWNSPNSEINITTYNLYLRNRNDESFTKIYDLIPYNINEITIQLEPFTDYQFKLEANNNVGNKTIFSTWLKTNYSKYFALTGNILFEGNILIE